MNKMAVGNKYLALLLEVFIVSAFMWPAILAAHPFGTDTYTIVYLTDIMLESEDMRGFQRTLDQAMSYEGFEDYAFGMWIFGSVLSQMTGLSPMELSIIVPQVWILFSSTALFLLGRLLLKSDKAGLLAVIFFLGMPIATTDFLTYETKTIALSMALMSFYMFLREDSIWRKTLSFNIPFLFVIITHPPTALLTMFSLTAYTVVNSLTQSREVTGDASALAVTVFLWAAVMRYFDPVYQHYIYNLRFLERLSTYLPSHISGLMNLLLNVFEQNNLQYFVIFYTILSMLLILLSKKLRMSSLNWRIRGCNMVTASKYVLVSTIVFLSALVLYSVWTNGLGGHLISQYTLVGSLFRIGPLHLILLPIGFIGADKRLLLLFMFLTLIIVPTALNYSGYTGTTRRTWYFILTIPLIVANGLKNTISIFRKETVKQIILGGTLLLVFSSSVVGTMYFAPEIAETTAERTSLDTMAENYAGSTVLAPNYRQRLELYGNVEDAIIHTKSSVAMNCWRNLVTLGGEKYVECLDELGVEYIIRSDRTVKKISGEELAEYSPCLDKPYSSRYFGVYGVR